MKTSLLSLLLLGAGLTMVPTQTAWADASTTSGQAAPSSASTCSGTGATGQRMERLKQAMDQLGLTDAQKEQIKQIRASVTDRKERFEQVVNVDL